MAGAQAPQCLSTVFVRLHSNDAGCIISSGSCSDPGVYSSPIVLSTQTAGHDPLKELLMELRPHHTVSPMPLSCHALTGLPRIHNHTFDEVPAIPLPYLFAKRPKGL